MKQTAYALKVAGAAALAGSTQAYGQIVPLAPNSLPGNLQGVSNSEPSETYSVLGGLSGADFRFAVYNNTDGSYFFTSSHGLKAAGGVAVNYPGGFYAAALSPGDKVNSTTLSFNNDFAVLAQLAYGYPAGQPVNTPTYLGFQFLDSNDGLLHNGWLELENETYTSSASPGGLFFINGAFNAQPDSAPLGAGDIAVGEVPEPGTLSSLVLGAAALGGLGLLRRRRSVQTIAQD